MIIIIKLLFSEVLISFILRLILTVTTVSERAASKALQNSIQPACRSMVIGQSAHVPRSSLQKHKVVMTTITKGKIISINLQYSCLSCYAYKIEFKSEAP